jgi:uncharacterized membrane protein
MVFRNRNNLRIFLLPLIIISILAIALFSFFGLDNSIFVDEAYSVYVASHNFEDIIENLKNDNGPPLYYFLLAIWIKAFGTSEFVIRSLSSIFYILSIIFVYVLGKSFYDKKTGLLCSFLYMLSPIAIRHAQNARMYSLLGLIGILSTLFFLRLFFLKTDSKKDFALYITFNILGTFTHYWFFFLMLSQVISHILLFSRSLFKKFSLSILISVVPFLLLWLPIFLLQMNNDSTAWIPEIGIFQGLVETLIDFFGKKFGFALLVYTAFLALIVFKIEGFKIKFQSTYSLKKFIIQKQNLAFFIFLFVSLLVPLIISQVKPIYLVGRYTIIALLPLVMVIGALLSKFGNKFLVLACCYILLAGVSTGFVIFKTRPQQSSDRATTEYLVKHAHNNDILIFTSISQVTIDYYLHLIKPDKPFIKISFPQEMASHPGWRNVDKMLSQKYMLETEANRIVSYIDDILVKNDNNKIWLFYGYDTEIGEILKKRLDTHFSLRREKKSKGSFYNKILVYQKYS